MEELKKKIEELLIGKEIKSIKIFNVNDSFFVFEATASWVFDGGIEIITEENILTLAWDHLNDGFSFKVDEGVESLLEGADYYQVEDEITSGVQNTSKQLVESLNLKCQFYQEYDENAQLKEEKTYVPTELVIRFNEDQLIKIALIDFGIDPATKQIGIAQYDLFGRLYLSLNEDLEIKEKQEF
jgi:hypothetical protein